MLGRKRMPSLPLVYFTPVGSYRLLRVGRQFTDLPLSKLVLHLAYYFGPTERKYMSPLSIHYVPGPGLCLWEGKAFGIRLLGFKSWLFLTSYVTVTKPLDLTVPQIPHL